MEIFVQYTQTKALQNIKTNRQKGKKRDKEKEREREREKQIERMTDGQYTKDGEDCPSYLNASIVELKVKQTERKKVRQRERKTGKETCTHAL